MKHVIGMLSGVYLYKNPTVIMNCQSKLKTYQKTSLSHKMRRNSRKNSQEYLHIQFTAFGALGVNRFARNIQVDNESPYEI